MELQQRLRELPPKGAIAVEGPAGSGRTTLLRRLAWTLGAEGSPVAAIERPASGLAMHQAVEIELAAHRGPGHAPAIVVVDAGDRLDDASRAALRKASEAGARLVVVGAVEVARALAAGAVGTFAVPPLAAADAQDLVHKAVPSLSDALGAHVVARTHGRPGALRRAVRLLANRAIVSRDDVDAALSGEATPSVAPASSSEQVLQQIERALDTGRFDEAAQLVDGLGETRSAAAKVKVALARRAHRHRARRHGRSAGRPRRDQGRSRGRVAAPPVAAPQRARLAPGRRLPRGCSGRRPRRRRLEGRPARRDRRRGAERAGRGARLDR